MTIDGSGTVNLLDDSDRLRPRRDDGRRPGAAIRSRDGQVRRLRSCRCKVTGTVAAPSVLPDFSAIVRQQLSQEVEEEVEERTRRSARAKCASACATACAACSSGESRAHRSRARRARRERARGGGDDRRARRQARPRPLLARGECAARGYSRVDLRRAHGLRRQRATRAFRAPTKRAAISSRPPTARRSSTRAWKAARFGTACRSSARSGSRPKRRTGSRARRCPRAATSSTARRSGCSSADGDGTKMTYKLEMEPDFFVPPVIGPWYLKRTLSQGGLRAVTRIERLARELDGRPVEPLPPRTRAHDDDARAAPARVVRRARPPRFAVAARAHAVLGLGVRDHAAADAGRHRDSVLRPVHAALPDGRRARGRAARRRARAWAGLGYYARARNLWRAARIVVAEHGGEAADDVRRAARAARHRPLDGRRDPRAGTRAALADSRRQREARARALSRRRGLAGRAARRRTSSGATRKRTRRTSASPTTRKRSWISARRSARARGRPAPCARSRAIARRAAAGTQAQYPAPRPKRERAQRHVAVLVVRAPDGRVLLERRPARGIWGGLYSLPELPAEDSPREWCARMLGAAVAAERALDDHRACVHALRSRSHAALARARRVARRPSCDRDDWHWCRPGSELAVGVPAPVALLLSSGLSSS